MLFTCCFFIIIIHLGDDGNDRCHIIICASLPYWPVDLINYHTFADPFHRALGPCSVLHFHFYLSVSECSMNDFITVTCLHVSARDYSNSINSSLGLPKFTFVMTYFAIECHLALEEYGLGPNDWNVDWLTSWQGGSWRTIILFNIYFSYLDFDLYSTFIFVIKQQHLVHIWNDHRRIKAVN